MPRYRGPVDIKIWSDDADRFLRSQTVSAKDVSLDGFYAYSDDPIEVGHRFYFRFEIPQTPIRQGKSITGLAEILRREQFSIGNCERFCIKARIAYARKITRFD
jgi:hypothetical protein